MASMARADASSIKVPSKDELKAIIEKAKSCADPQAYMKCVVSNYAVSASGSTLPQTDCSTFCSTSM
jgi:hypothetical protein